MYSSPEFIIIIIITFVSCACATWQLNRKDGKFAEGANEELHVYICGDTVEKVDAAVDLIQPLLTPVDVSCHPTTNHSAL